MEFLSFCFTAFHGCAIIECKVFQMSTVSLVCSNILPYFSANLPLGLAGTSFHTEIYSDLI